ncbi:armadillo-type protein [Roridomyces roridus]|uniref:Armadillo-type protein n=1 Tax=Roridomyces roridus TaxID=1738132 RepID=A0AAD7FGG1_9AGAR|nr:armadillo-type protein [Roridomyces roridus]
MPTMLNLLQDPEEDVRIAAIHAAVALRALRPVLILEELLKFDKLIHIEWRNLVAKLQDLDWQTHRSAWDKIPQLARSISLATNRQVPDFETPIMAALQDPSPDVPLCALTTLAKLAEIAGFRAVVLHLIPCVIACFSDNRNEIRLQSLRAALCLAEYDDFHPRIYQGVQKIISTSKDRDGKVRSTSLKLLLKLAEGFTGKIPEKIKQTAPHLLTLLQHQSTRRNAVALLTCLAEDQEGSFLSSCLSG